jgi:hypothetical protein
VTLPPLAPKDLEKTCRSVSKSSGTDRRYSRAHGHQRPGADYTTRRPTMRFMVMHYQTQEMEDGVRPSPEVQAAIGQYMQEAAMTGVLLTGEGVVGSSEGARVEITDGNVRVIDGPFAGAKELIAGFAILDVRSLEEAVEHARKFALLVGSDRVDR